MSIASRRTAWRVGATGETGRPVAGGNPGEGEMDRGAVADGDAGLREQPAVSLAAGDAELKSMSEQYQELTPFRNKVRRKESL